MLRNRQRKGMWEKEKLKLLEKKWLFEVKGLRLRWKMRRVVTIFRFGSCSSVPMFVSGDGGEKVSEIWSENPWRNKGDLWYQECRIGREEGVIWNRFTVRKCREGGKGNKTQARYQEKEVFMELKIDLDEYKNFSSNFSAHTWLPVLCNFVSHKVTSRIVARAIEYKK